MSARLEKRNEQPANGLAAIGRRFGQPEDERFFGAVAARPDGGDSQQLATGSARKPLDHEQAGRVGPVQIFEQHDHRVLRGAERSEQGREAIDESVLALEVAEDRGRRVDAEGGFQDREGLGHDAARVAERLA